MQKVCGACQLQFIDYDYQLKLKKQMVEDAMRTIGHVTTPVNDTISSPKIKNYRQKVQYPISQTKNSGRIIAGYYKPQSHEIVNIKYCPIQPEICDKIIEFIRIKAPQYKISGFNEKKHNGDLRHIVIRGSEYSNNFLVTLVVNSTKTFDKLNNFAKAIYDEFEEVSGVCINFNSKKTNVILGQNTQCICGNDYVDEKIIDKVFKIGANTFFQINPKSAENIFKYVKKEVEKLENPTVLDAYAGIATFGIVVSDIAQKVVSVEENVSSIEKAKEVLQTNNIDNIELFAQDTTKYLKSVKRKFDITILDPPRKGCTKEALDEALAHTKQKIVYVSCNPATLARDLNYLQEKGCKVESIQPFDMFCHTYHVETVAIVTV
jgi:23S rRNA (uracil1939-C5)-methyltransferase